MVNGEKNSEKKKLTRKEEQERTNTILFWVALGASTFMILFLSASFFRDYLNMHDVEYGIISVVLGLITLYAGNNKALQRRCGEEEKKFRNGELIFTVIVFWGLIIWGIYQTRVTYQFWGIDMVVPGQFYTFLLGVIAIFGGSKMYDFFSSRKNNNNKEA